MLHLGYTYSTAASAGEDSLKVDSAVEAESTVVEDVNPVDLVVTGGIEDRNLAVQLAVATESTEVFTYIASLHKVAADEEVLLVGRNLDVVGTNDGLLLVGVVEALDVVEVGDVESGDVVADSEGKIGKLSVVGNVRVDGDRLLSLGAEFVEELGDTLLAVGILAERVDDPDLAILDSTIKISMCDSRVDDGSYVARAALSLLPGINLTS